MPLTCCTLYKSDGLGFVTFPLEVRHEQAKMNIKPITLPSGVQVTPKQLEFIESLFGKATQNINTAIANIWTLTGMISKNDPQLETFRAADPFLDTLVPIESIQGRTDDVRQFAEDCALSLRNFLSSLTNASDIIAILTGLTLRPFHGVKNKPQRPESLFPGFSPDKADQSFWIAIDYFYKLGKRSAIDSAMMRPFAEFCSYAVAAYPDAQKDN